MSDLTKINSKRTFLSTDDHVFSRFLPPFGSNILQLPVMLLKIICQILCECFVRTFRLCCRAMAVLALAKTCNRDWFISFCCSTMQCVAGHNRPKWDARTRRSCWSTHFQRPTTSKFFSRLVLILVLCRSYFGSVCTSILLDVLPRTLQWKFERLHQIVVVERSHTSVVFRCASEHLHQQIIDPSKWKHKENLQWTSCTISWNSACNIVGWSCVIGQTFSEPKRMKQSVWSCKTNSCEWPVSRRGNICNLFAHSLPISTAVKLEHSRNFGNVVFFVTKCRCTCKSHSSTSILPFLSISTCARHTDISIDNATEDKILWAKWRICFQILPFFQHWTNNGFASSFLMDSHLVSVLSFSEWRVSVNCGDDTRSSESVYWQVHRTSVSANVRWVLLNCQRLSVVDNSSLHMRAFHSKNRTKSWMFFTKLEWWVLLMHMMVLSPPLVWKQQKVAKSVGDIMQLLNLVEKILVIPAWSSDSVATNVLERMNFRWFVKLQIFLLDETTSWLQLLNHILRKISRSNCETSNGFSGINKRSHRNTEDPECCYLQGPRAVGSHCWKTFAHEKSQDFSLAAHLGCHHDCVVAIRVREIRVANVHQISDDVWARRGAVFQRLDQQAVAKVVDCGIEIQLPNDVFNAWNVTSVHCLLEQSLFVCSHDNIWVSSDSFLKFEREMKTWGEQTQVHNIWPTPDRCQRKNCADNWREQFSHIMHTVHISPGSTAETVSFLLRCRCCLGLQISFESGLQKHEMTVWLVGVWCWTIPATQTCIGLRHWLQHSKTCANIHFVSDSSCCRFSVIFLLEIAFSHHSTLTFCRRRWKQRFTVKIIWSATARWSGDLNFGILDNTLKCKQTTTAQSREITLSLKTWKPRTFTNNAHVRFQVPLTQCTRFGKPRGQHTFPFFLGMSIVSS